MQNSGPPNLILALGRKHMAHNHGSEYQVRIVHGDGTEELSGWLNSREQVARAIVDHKQGKAYWIQARNILCDDCPPDREQRTVECPLTGIPSLRYSPHDSLYLVEAGSKSRYDLVEVGSRSRYEVEVNIWNRHRAA